MKEANFEQRTMMEGPSMLSEMVLKNENDEDRIEDKSAMISVRESLSKNPLEALQQNLEQEIFQKEILMEEKEILVFKSYVIRDFLFLLVE